MEHQRLRVRLTSGLWQIDAQTALFEMVGADRAEHYSVDLGANTFQSTCEGASALYDLPPRISHSSPAADPSLLAQIARTGALWPTMCRVQSDVLAIREELVRLNVVRTSSGPRASYLPVRIDLVEMVPDPLSPMQPCEVSELVEYNGTWFREVWSCMPGQQPYHTFRTMEGANANLLHGLPEEGQVGPFYPWRRADGSPFIPYVLYHASTTGRLLDPFYKSEIIYGTLRVSVLWSFLVHGILKASWPQRWVGNGTIAGAATREDGSSPRVSSDPAIVVELIGDPSMPGQVTAGQWSLSMDPEALARTVGLYETRLAQYAGIDALELQRTSNDPMSGYAMAVSAAGKRSAQRKYSPVFQPSDELVLELTACMSNRVMESTFLPEFGWQVEHIGLPPSPQERVADREEVLALLSAGLMGKAEARSRLLGETRDQASKEIASMGVDLAGR